MTLPTLLLLLLTSCAPMATTARMDGFNSQWRGFASIQGEPFEDVIVDLRLRVKVVDDPAKIGPGLAGAYLHPGGIIVLPGKMVNGKIIVPEVVIGHEAIHALQYQDRDGRFVNPDDLTEMGF